MKSIFIRRIRYKFLYKVRKISLLKYILIFLLMGFIIFSLYVYEKNFKPQIYKIAENKAYYLCNKAISEGTMDALKENNITYSDFFTLIKDENNNIKGIMSNLIAVQRLSASFTNNINKKITEMDKSVICIYMGNLTGVELFSGLGPKLKINIIPTGYTVCNFKNSFKEAGINQTRHEIYLEVKVSINVLLPNHVSKVTTVVSKIPLIENIIVGDVPESITKLETDEENLRDDFVNMM